MDKHEIPRAKVGQYYVEMRAGSVVREFYVTYLDGSRIKGVMIAHVPTHVGNIPDPPKTLINFASEIQYLKGWRKGESVFTSQHGEKRPLPNDFNHRMMRAIFNYTIVNDDKISLGQK
jgi:hypothetical protein